MLRELMSHTTLLHLPLFAMAIFFAIFVAVSVKTMLTRREIVDRLANLPFEEGDGKDEEEAGHG
jgi:Na+/glutamate symporter